ncbi:uncharacterized protein LOC120334056 isoform X7 [Styela clava]
MFKEFDPKSQTIKMKLLKFTEKRVRPKASDHGDDVEVYSKRVRSKASDHKDDVEVYSKSQSDSEVDDSTLSLEHCSWADTDRWGVATYSGISLHPLILRRMQRI